MCMAWRFHFPIRNYDFNLSVHVTLMETHFAKLNTTKRELVKLTRAVNSAR